MWNRLRNALIAALMTLCGACAPEGPPVLQQEWFPFAGFAGELIPPPERDSSRYLRFSLRAGSETINPIQEVMAGRALFGVVAADRLLQARGGGIDVVAIGVINNDSPTVFLALGDSGVRSPADFRGKTVGVLEGTNTEYIYRLLMTRAGVDRSSVTEVAVPFDLGTFLLGRYAIRPAFAYDEPVTLELAGRAYTMIHPGEFGVEFIGTVYFTSGRVLREQPDLVQRFVNTVAHGWMVALVQPDSAIKLLTSFEPAIDGSREHLALVRGQRYFSGADNRVLTVSAGRWESTIAGLRELGILGDQALAGYWDSTFISTFHARVQGR